MFPACDTRAQVCRRPAVISSGSPPGGGPAPGAPAPAVPVAGLAPVCAAPAQRDGAAGVSGDGAGVLGTGSDLAGRSWQLHLDRRQVLVDAEPGSQLSEGIVTPADDVALAVE